VQAAVEHAEEPGRGDARDHPAAHLVRAAGLLHHCAGGGVRKPGALDGVRYGRESRRMRFLSCIPDARTTLRPEVTRRIMIGTYALSAATMIPTTARLNACAP